MFEISKNNNQSGFNLNERQTQKLTIEFRTQRQKKMKSGCLNFVQILFFRLTLHYMIDIVKCDVSEQQCQLTIEKKIKKKNT